MSAPLDIQLGRLDVHSMGANRRHCVAVLKSSKGKRDKLVSGGEDGVVQCVAVKKGETQLVFKNPPGKREVTALTLGGSAGGPRDRIYAAFGQSIQGVNKKKGQQFFLYSTVLHEDISSLYVEDLCMYTATTYSLNVFEASAKGDQVSDVHFYMAPDRVNHMLLTRVPGVNGNNKGDDSWNSVLGCQDKHLRVVKDSDLLFEARVDGAVLSVATYDGPTPPERQADDGLGGVTAPRSVKVGQEHKQILYGTENGLVGQYLADSHGMKAGWLLGKDADGAAGKRAGVTALTLADVTLSGFDDVVVGRDDGSIEVFPYDVYNPDGAAVFSRDLHESITTLDKGQVIAANSSDIIASTYAGKVIAFTHELKHSSVAHIAPKLSNIKEGAPVASASTSVGLPGTIVAPDGSSTNVMQESKADLEKSIRDLQMELEKLTERVSREKEKYASKVSAELIAVEQQFKLKQSFVLLPAEACYLLTLEIDMPLDCITLQSSIPVMLLDVESNGCMLSRTDRDEKQSNELLATYRATENTNRVEIKIRTVEGQHGALNAYIIPKLQPKTCQRAELRIKPLSLHEKVYKEAIAQELATRPLSTLTLTGAFSLPDVHAWVQLCLPDVSSKLSSSDGTHILYFRSTFLKTVLTVEYSKGRCTFRSDSVTAISIVKEVLTKEATSKKIQIQVELDLALPSIKAFLNMLKPELDTHFTLAKRHALIAPLKEIATHEMGLVPAAGAAGAPATGVAGASIGGSASTGGILAHLEELSSFLQPSYIEILRDSDKIEAALKSAPRHLDFLRGIVTDLFVDMHKLQGRSAQARVPQLLAILEDYNFEKLLAAFEGRA